MESSHLSTSNQLPTSDSFRPEDTITSESFATSTPTTRSHSVITDYTKKNSVSKEYDGASMFSMSTKAVVDADSTTSGLIITKDPMTPDIDQQ